MNKEREPYCPDNLVELLHRLTQRNMLSGHSRHPQTWRIWARLCCVCEVDHYLMERVYIVDVRK